MPTNPVLDVAKPPGEVAKGTTAGENTSEVVEAWGTGAAAVISVKANAITKDEKDTITNQTNEENGCSWIKDSREMDMTTSDVWKEQD